MRNETKNILKLLLKQAFRNVLYSN